MDPATAISLFSVGASLVERMIPIIRDLHLKGQINAAQQQQVLDRYQSLKTRADGQFTGPQWEPTPNTN